MTPPAIRAALVTLLGLSILIEPAFADQKAEQIAKTRYPARQRTGRQPRLLAAGKVLVQILGRGRPRHSLPGQKRLQVPQIGPVGRQRVGRQAFLHLAVGQKGFGGAGKPALVRHWSNDTITAKLFERKGLRPVQS